MLTLTPAGGGGVGGVDVGSGNDRAECTPCDEGTEPDYGKSDCVSLCLFSV